MQRIYFTDFDGTITKKDTCNAMVEKYAKGDWQKAIQGYDTGELTTKKCAEFIFQDFHVTPKELAEFIKSIPIDKSFIEFVEFVENRKEKLYILSDGFDFNLEIVLNKLGLDRLKRYSNQLKHDLNNNWSMESKYPSTTCSKCGTCKKNLLQELKGDAKQIIYIGDGVSDMCACSQADIVFAKQPLLSYCQKNNIPVVPFQSFHNIIEWLKNHSNLTTIID